MNERELTDAECDEIGRNVYGPRSLIRAGWQARDAQPCKQCPLTYSHSPLAPADELVTRLREHPTGTMVAEFKDFRDPLRLEAADRIQRLEEMRVVADIPHYYRPRPGTYSWPCAGDKRRTVRLDDADVLTKSADGTYTKHTGLMMTHIEIPDDCVTRVNGLIKP